MALLQVIDEMEVIVKGSSMICPSQHTPKETHWISNLDMVMIPSHVPVLHFYKPNGSSDFFKPQLLKEALSRTLVPFYPMAGRFEYDENDRLQIVCNAQGALWIEAETSSTIDDLDDFTQRSKLQKLIPVLDYSGGATSYPLVIAQVTTFKCGGVCLCVGIHHILSDGTASQHFINSWSELARGLSQISVAPVINRNLLRARVPPTPRFHHVEYDPPLSLNEPLHSNPEPASLLTFKITPKQLDALKAKLLDRENKTKYSTFTILAAHTWRCATKARGLLDDQPTKLIMPVNGRPRLHPPIPSGYLGNVFFTAASSALSGDLRSEPLINTVKRVHGALQRMDDEYLRSAIDYLETLPDITSIRRGPKNFKSPNLQINHMMRLSLYDTDFGWGRPIYVTPNNLVSDGKISLLSSAADDGSLSVVACLEKSHLKVFEKHLYEGLVS